MDTSALLQILDDIIKGYTETRYNKKPVFVKHFSLFDQAEFEKVYSFHFDRAKKKIHTEKQRLEICIKEGLWSEEKDKEITVLAKTISSLEDSRKRIILPSQLESTNERIKNEKKKLAKIEADRRETLGFTCEVFASQKMNNFSIYKAFYVDKDFNTPLFDQEEFDELESEDLSVLAYLYTGLSNKYETKNIKRVAISNFFQNYYYLSDDNAVDFMGKPIIQFSIYQVRLLNYGKYFKTLISQTENIPNDIAQDPDKLIDYVEMTKSRDKSMKTNKNRNVGVVGATKSDLESLKGEYDVDDTHEKLQASGKKSLSMRDLLELQEKKK